MARKLNAQQRRSKGPAKKNIVRRGQRATLNGKKVIADGKGNWKLIPKGSAGNGLYTGAKAGSYKAGEDRKRTPAKTSKTPANTTPSSRSTMGKPGVIEGDKSGATKAQRERDAAIKRTASVKARAAAKAKAAKAKSTKAPAAPKLPPRPKATPAKSTPTKAKSSAKKLTPMQQWAKANPGLAKKVKKGQSGYKEIKNGRSSKPRNWLAKNYKPKKK